MIRQEGEECSAHEGEIGEGVGVTRARAVLAPDGVAAPVVANFDAGPVALDEREPLGGSVRGGLGAGKAIADFVGGDGGALHRAGAARDDHGAGVGEVSGERFEREGVELRIRLRAEAARVLASHQRPVAIRFVENLKLTESEKIARQ